MSQEVGREEAEEAEAALWADFFEAGPQESLEVDDYHEEPRRKSPEQKAETMEIDELQPLPGAEDHDRRLREEKEQD
eukprot:543510-Heterocapsa_arctica.AAC.1